MNLRRWSLPVWGYLKLLEKGVLRFHCKDFNASDERTESRREFQIVGAAAHKEREPKMRSV